MSASPNLTPDAAPRDASDYTPSDPADAALLERIVRRLHDGASLEEIRLEVMKAYFAGYSQGCGEAFAAPQVVLTEERIAQIADYASPDVVLPAGAR